MRRSTGGKNIPVRGPAFISAKTSTSSPEICRKSQSRRWIRGPTLLAGDWKRGTESRGGRKRGPTTPLLRWKFDEEARRSSRNAGGEAARTTSVRKIGASISNLQIPESGSGEGDGFHARLGFESLSQCNPSHPRLHTSTKNEFSRSNGAHNPKSGILRKIDASVALPNATMERATKWDPVCPNAFDEVYRVYGNLELFDEQVATSPTLSALRVRAELDLAHTRINELETERESAKKRLNHILIKLSEEKDLWKCREHDKIQAVIGPMKDELKRERRARKQVEIMNSKLVAELSEVKLSAKRFLKDCENERKNRELMEEVCDELAKEIGEEKAEVEALKFETMEIQQELEEERKMLQTAEVWREERVQMKLIDAKLLLEEKYSELCKLQADIKHFLIERSGTNLEVDEIKEAQLLNDAAVSIKVQDIKEFSYQPPPSSEDIFSIIEELQARHETTEIEAEPHKGFSPASRSSKSQLLSPDVNGFLKRPAKGYTIGSIDKNPYSDYDSSWETVSHVDEQGSSNSTDGSEPSVDRTCKGSNKSASGRDWEENGDNCVANAHKTEGFSFTSNQLRKKASSIARLWRSSSPKSTENFKKHPIEAAIGRLSNGRTSNATQSPAGISAEVCLGSTSIGTNSVNIRDLRGMNGFVNKQELNAKFLESQKIQLRDVLEQKI